MIRPPDEFFTAEFTRYSAECRRMARFARPPSKPVTRNPAADLLAQWTDWFGLQAKSTPRYQEFATRRR
jgi:hypothetical protein